MGTEQDKHYRQRDNESSHLDKLVEVGSYSRLTQQNLKKSMKAVFPDKPGDSFITYQEARKRKVEPIKLAGLTDEENTQLNFILSGQAADE
ncbi:hypothetical protein FLL45_11510 [Aliikangiella marina]|uniref:Uncharacterized protein n=1 Tax=Aliikangiella marina TaxID=1712262 RepID=A0A545TE84_9GAMM|nr:hypothetical protein [Aliikangiella marina]TQV75535.1 hypothetical protein FLL45_11510 [Aliikangiella marina]